MVSFCNASLDIKQSADGTQAVPGLIDVPIYDIDGAWEILRAGARNRLLRQPMQMNSAAAPTGEGCGVLPHVMYSFFLID